jgi:hypothetical protein
MTNPIPAVVTSPEITSNTNVSFAGSGLIGHAAGKATSPAASDIRTLLGLATTNTPQFAGVQLGVSGFLIGGTNSVTQRNGTNAQIFDLVKTFTSDTIFECLTLDSASDAANYRIGSKIGASGGTARGLQFGSRNAAGVWSNWFSLATNGEATFFSGLTANGNATGVAIQMQTGQAFRSTGGVFIDFASGGTGSFTIRGGSGFGNRLIIAVGGGLTWVPFTTSQTPSANNQFTIEMTSNTAGNLVYRGSDGVTRRMALTFV